MTEEPQGLMDYFAYGAEMHRDRMRELCPEAKPLHPARIPHHTVTFTGRSDAAGGGLATISLASGRDLWGAVYRIEDGCRQALEEWGRENGYVWSWTQVRAQDGERERVGTLVKVRDLETTTPGPAYLEALKEAWRDWGLDPAGLVQARPPTEDS